MHVIFSVAMFSLFLLKLPLKIWKEKKHEQTFYMYDMRPPSQFSCLVTVHSEECNFHSILNVIQIVWANSRIHVCRPVNCKYSTWTWCKYQSPISVNVSKFKVDVNLQYDNRTDVWHICKLFLYFKVICSVFNLKKKKKLKSVRIWNTIWPKKSTDSFFKYHSQNGGKTWMQL